MSDMKTRIISFLIVASITLFIASNCSTGEDVSISDDSDNTAPLVSAGIDLNVVTGFPVILDGSGSYDPDGDLISYQWSFQSKPAGSSAVLVDATTVNPYFMPDVDGTYVISLTVNDGTTDSPVETVTITAGVTAQNPPIADAGIDRNVITGSLVTLDGSGSWDPDDDVLSYFWLLKTKPAGSKAKLSEADSVNPSFTADVAGDYVITLIVNDGNADSAFDDVTITAGSIAQNAPVANAGKDKNVVTGLIVTLDGSKSSDPDGDSLSYLWTMVSQPAGSTSALSSVSVVKPSFTPDADGSYVISLLVNDGTVDSAVDTVTVTASSSSGNTPPVADAGDDQDVVIGLPVILSGGDSYDVDLGSYSSFLIDYHWTLVTKPAGSSATLDSTTSRNTSFTPDVEGDYNIRLVVSDDFVDSAPDTVLVSATEYSLLSDYDIVDSQCSYSTNSEGAKIANITVWVVNRGASDPGANLQIEEEDVFLGRFMHVDETIYETADGNNSTAYSYSAEQRYQVVSWYAKINDADSDFDFKVIYCN